MNYIVRSLKIRAIFWTEFQHFSDWMAHYYLFRSAVIEIFTWEYDSFQMLAGIEILDGDIVQVRGISPSR